MRKIFSTLILLQLLPILAFAQEINTPKVNLPIVINCNEYYKNGNLSVDIKAKEADIKAGDTISFSGVINNKNYYPVPNTDVFVQIVRSGSDEEIVDQFFVLENTLIKERKDENVPGKIDLNFTWKAPVSIKAGDYKIISYVSQNHRLNIDESYIKENSSILNFKIKNDKLSDYLYIDINSLTLNGKKYSKDLTFENNEKIIVSFDIKNTTNNIIDGSIKISSYYNNIGDQNNNTNSNLEYFTLDKGQTKNITYTDNSYGSKAKLLAELYYSDAKSISSINLIRNGYIEATINSIGINKFPIKGADDISAFICFSTNNSTEIKEADIDIDVLGSDMSPLLNKAIKNNLSQIISGFLLPFKSYKDQNSLSLIAKIKKDDVVLDQVIIDYPSNNSLDKDLSINNHETREMDNSGKVSIIVITLVLLLGITTYFISHKKKTFPNVANSENNNQK